MLVGTAAPWGQVVWHVDSNAAGAGDEIWVAEGVYKPTYDYGLGIGTRNWKLEKF